MKAASSLWGIPSARGALVPPCQPVQAKSTGQVESNPESLAVLYGQLGPVIRRYMAHWLGAAAAEDATADVFLHALSTQQGYCAHRGPLSSWLWGIVRHVRATYLRQKYRRVTGQAPRLPLRDHLADVEEQVAVHLALTRLSPADRDLLVRHYRYGESFAAIAARRGLSLGAVKMQARRGATRLRALLLP